MPYPYIPQRDESAVAIEISPRDRFAGATGKPWSRSNTLRFRSPDRLVQLAAKTDFFQAIIQHPPG